jgi:hypothetical protein
MRSVHQRPASKAPAVLLAPKVALHNPKIFINPVTPGPPEARRVVRMPETEPANEILKGKTNGRELNRIAVKPRTSRKCWNRGDLL